MASNIKIQHCKLVQEHPRLNFQDKMWKCEMQEFSVFLQDIPLQLHVKIHEAEYSLSSWC